MAIFTINVRPRVKLSPTIRERETFRKTEYGLNAYELYAITTTDSPVKSLSEWLASLQGPPTTREGLGLDIGDSPEFSDLTVPALNSISEGGGIPDEQVEWINADAKSAKSFIQKILGYIYSIKDVVVFATPRTGVTLTGSILLDRSYTKYTSKTLTSDLTLSVASNPVDGGNAYIEVIGDGVHDVTYNGITLYPTSAPFDIAINKVNRGALMYEGAMAYIAWTQMN